MFVYEKRDEASEEVARLAFQQAVFVRMNSTADYQTTFGLIEILRRNGNVDDVSAFLEERNLPLDEIGWAQLAERIVTEPPQLGVLTMSNALQWRLPYGRALVVAGREEGVERLL